MERRYTTVSEAYLGTLLDIYQNPECVSSPRGQECLEKFNYQFTIVNPQVEIISTKDSDRNIKINSYSQKEFKLYDSQSNLVEDFSKASPFWKTLANPDGTVNSAYGYLIWKNKSHGNPEYNKKEMVTPWEWAKKSLINDEHTRQAILRFSLPEHQWEGNKDQTCTLHGIFMIRNNKLNLTINMRSNDMMLGLVYDLPWFISLMYKMKAELKEFYPALEVGDYSHYVHNIHIYKRDELAIRKMLGLNDL